MSPELRAFKHYRKNSCNYIKPYQHLPWNEIDYDQIHRDVANKFKADFDKFQNLLRISHERIVNRVLGDK
jgi:hypothetical protein